MTAGALVREVRFDELEALLALYGHLHQEDDPPPPEAKLRQLWDSIVANPMLRYFAAEADGHLVASCALTIIPNLTHGARPYGLIENVVTHADYRRRGIGTAVLRHALQVAWDANCYKVMLQTGRDLAEVGPFYERAGFRRGSKTGFIATPPDTSP
ncbi:MAG: GNAT family N-acetyltransferase [Planctomycetota bacterium]|jgi:GNAT superfamily N-acetyltransferase